MDDICSQQIRSLGSKYTKIRLPPVLWEAYGSLPNPFDGFEGLFAGMEKEGREGKEMKESDGKGGSKTRKHPQYFLSSCKKKP